LDTIRPEKKHLTADLLAGLTFALVKLPQSMAHALLATVNPVLGLYTLMATPVGALRFSLPEEMDLSQFSVISLRVAVDPQSSLNKMELIKFGGISTVREITACIFDKRSVQQKNYIYIRFVIVGNN